MHPRPILRVALPLLGTALAITIPVAACSTTRPAGPPSTPTLPAPRPMAVTASTRWDAPADAAAAAAQAGLPMLGQEMLAVHYHAHLDVRIAGTPILVPAGLGIDVARQQISPLHTHDATGVVHIESQADIPYAPGQLFIEWGQPLTAGQVGPHRPAPREVLRVFRNGHPVTSDPAALRFAQHDEDVVWVGQATTHPTVPSTYPFPQGL